MADRRVARGRHPPRTASNRYSSRSQTGGLGGATARSRSLPAPTGTPSRIPRHSGPSNAIIAARRTSSTPGHQLAQRDAGAFDEHPRHRRLRRRAFRGAQHSGRGRGGPRGPTTSVTSSSINSASTPKPTPTDNAKSPSLAPFASPPNAPRTRAGNPASLTADAATTVSLMTVPPEIWGDRSERWHAPTDGTEEPLPTSNSTDSGTISLSSVPPLWQPIAAGHCVLA